MDSRKQFQRLVHCFEKYAAGTNTISISVCLLSFGPRDRMIDE